MLIHDVDYYDLVGTTSLAGVLSPTRAEYALCGNFDLVVMLEL
jgi:hypothetical protein